MIALSRALGPEKIGHLETAVVVSPLDVPIAGEFGDPRTGMPGRRRVCSYRTNAGNQLSLIAATAPSKVASHRVCKSNCGVGGAVWRPASSVSSNRRVIASHSTRPADALNSRMIWPAATRGSSCPVAAISLSVSKQSAISPSLGLDLYSEHQSELIGTVKSHRRDSRDTGSRSARYLC